MSFRLTRSVKVLLISCFAMFILQQTGDQFFGTNIMGWLGLVPAAFVINHRIWQLFTYAFLHGDVMHLFLNLMMLAFIGGEIEATWGAARFLRYYFFCSISAGVIYLLMQLLIWKGDGLFVPMVGASGAIYGLLMAYGLIFGERVMLFMMLFPMKAKHFVWILAGIEFMSSIYSGRGGLPGIAHLGGMAAGFVYLWTRATWLVALKKRASLGPARKPAKKRPGHLKLVKTGGKDPGGGPSGPSRGSRGSSDDDGDGNPTIWH